MKKTPIELNKLAAFIVDQTTNEDKKEETQTKNQAAVELGRLGGLKGEKLERKVHLLLKDAKR